VAETELALTLLPSEARAATRRWLAEARIARDLVRFALPPASDLGPGDVVRLPAPDGARLWRIERVDLAGAREVEAVRVEPGPYRGGLEPDDDPEPRSYTAPAGVTAAFLDLPLITGEEVPQAPHLAATATPWPGPVAAWQGPFPEGDFVLAGTVEAPAAIGQTLSALPPARPALWQRGVALLVRMPAGVTLESRSRTEVLAGANRLALGTGADWEVLQFATAQLVGPDLWQLSDLIRGQFGTEWVAGGPWPAGAAAVLLDTALRQVDLPLALRAQPRRWRVGPAALAVDDPALAERVEAFRGVGLRPYAPVHLRARRAGPGAALGVRWIRRSRLAGDDWEAFEVPLGEESERYLVRVIWNGDIAREAVTTAPEWTYETAAQAADGVTGPFELRVAQVSAVWGPGPFARCAVPG
jgi:hypothetical protein